MIGAAATEWHKPVVVQTIFPDSPSARVLADAGDPRAPRHRPRLRRAGRAGHAPGARTRADPFAGHAPRRHVVRRRAGAARRGWDRRSCPPVSCTTWTPSGRRSPSRRCRSRSCSRPSAACTSPTPAASSSGCRTPPRPRRPTSTWSRASTPPAVSVEVMADLDAGVELIVGCLRDPRFGPVLMVGLGGVFAEVLGDTAVALAPVSRDGARAAAHLAARRTPARRSPGSRSGRPRRARGPRGPGLRRRGGPPGARRARGQPGAGDARRGARPRRARRTRRARSGLDVAQVALVERVHPGVLRREDAVVERA